MCKLRCYLWVIPCLTGCVTTTLYPDDWPRQEAATTAQCPDLSGSYENYGRYASDIRPLLADIFFPARPDDPLSTHYEREAVSHLSLDETGSDGIAIRAWVGTDLLMERRLNAEQLPCREGRRVYHVNEWVVEGLVWAVGHSASDYLISLASDGSLLLERKGLDAGVVFLVIPLAAKWQDWLRFPRTSPDRRSGDNDPRGVRTGTAPAYTLLLPEGAAKWTGYEDATACLVQAQTDTDAPPAPQWAGLLDGRSTQAFILQGRPDGVPTPAGRSHDRMGWVPATHTQRIEKLHWQPSSVADRYVVCLLEKGYRWEDGSH